MHASTNVTNGIDSIPLPTILQWTVSIANMNTFMDHACSEEARNTEAVTDAYIEETTVAGTEIFCSLRYLQTKELEYDHWCCCKRY